MVLSSESIRELLDSGRLVVKPLDSNQIQPASIDLKISGEILISKGKEIDFGKEPEYEKREGNEIILPPKTHVLVRTLERVELPNDVGGITKLRSSASRIGFKLETFLIKYPATPKPDETDIFASYSKSSEYRAAIWLST